MKTKRYLETMTNDVKTKCNKLINLPTFARVGIDLIQTIKETANEINEQLASLIPKLTVEPYRLIQEKHREV